MIPEVRSEILQNANEDSSQGEGHHPDGGTVPDEGVLTPKPVEESADGSLTGDRSLLERVLAPSAAVRVVSQAGGVADSFQHQFRNMSKSEFETHHNANSALVEPHSALVSRPDVFRLDEAKELSSEGLRAAETRLADERAVSPSGAVSVGTQTEITVPPVAHGWFFHPGDAAPPGREVGIDARLRAGHRMIGANRDRETPATGQRPYKRFAHGDVGRKSSPSGAFPVKMHARAKRFSSSGGWLPSLGFKSRLALGVVAAVLSGVLGMYWLAGDEGGYGDTDLLYGPSAGQYAAFIQRERERTRQPAEAVQVPIQHGDQVLESRLPRRQQKGDLESPPAEDVRQYLNIQPRYAVPARYYDDSS
ncbi:hypothetical protein BESB_074430 [Besnoitia besnoiti]|uniref:Uncharacterized protein n=1 Tax=Besnoitia besnoiti TaxID=94643 RepID=A0A2A9MDC2_BESBE|nr:uncharacterized protein BESB_074430 [Besnoitia besnoiti]PFH34291.1 hypothetical protein BESB_074430 [Besnoitia besnoiti]